MGWQMVLDRFLEVYQKSRVILLCKVILKALKGYLCKTLSQKGKKKAIANLLWETIASTSNCHEQVTHIC